MKTKNTLREISMEEMNQISGGASDEEKGFWYKVGKFFAEQANANDSIRQTYGNTNNNL